MMTREEELRLMAEFIEKKGITMLPKVISPDPSEARFSAWGGKKKKKNEHTSQDHRRGGRSGGTGYQRPLYTKPQY